MYNWLIGYTLTLCIVIIVLVYVFTQKVECQANYDNLQLKYEIETQPLQVQVKDYKQRIFQNEEALEKANAEINSLRMFEKNTIGKFDDTELVGPSENSCVTVSDNTKSDFTLLQLSKNCTMPEKAGIFSYDPIYRQLQVNLGPSKKCIDAVNETDVVVNECLRTSQKQKFNYFPFSDGGFKSILYNRCLGYDNDTGIITLKKCGDIDSIKTPINKRDKHVLFEYA